MDICLLRQEGVIYNECILVINEVLGVAAFYSGRAADRFNTSTKSVDF